MALTKSIQAVLRGSPVSGTYQPVAAELETLLTELVVDGSNPTTKANKFLANSPALSGYTTGAGGEVTQATSRTTGVTLNTPCGRVVLFTAAGSTSWTEFVMSNSLVGATDVVAVSQRGGTNNYEIHTKVAAGSITFFFRTTGGTASDAPSFNFSVISTVTA